MQDACKSSIMVWLGFIVGQLFGCALESLFTGAIIAISSTTIIAKAFDEQGVTGKLREIVVGILIVEDLIAVLLMAILTALASGSGLSAGPPKSSSAGGTSWPSPGRTRPSQRLGTSSWGITRRDG